jgi:class 3 adenylate cyclase
MKYLNFIHKRPLVTIIILFMFGGAAIFVNMVYLSSSINKELSLKYADSYLVALNTFHSFYSTDVVARAKEAGIVVSDDYKNIPGAIPVPATFSIELAEKITETENGVSTRLYSNFPFSNRLNGGPRDKYEHNALSQLRFAEDKTIPFIAYETIDDQLMLRFSKSLVMAQSCVNCHNSHPNSTKKDWVVGDVRGARVVNIALNHVRNIARPGWLMTLFTMATSFIILLLLIYVIIQALRSSIRMLSLTNTAYNRFVPHEFLSYLNKQSIIDVELNDNVEKQMTILFSDIRSFTTLSEGMTPEENFKFINDYLSVMGPIIRHNKGFIDKYIGDGIMALFDNTDDAVNAGIQMIEALKNYNSENVSNLSGELNIGVGIHRGKLRLGAVGEHGRMDGTVISDAVNLAARIESATKIFGSQFLISEHALQSMEQKDDLRYRLIGEVKVKGKSKPVTLYDILSTDSDGNNRVSDEAIELFEDAVKHFQVKSYTAAKQRFEKYIVNVPSDVAALYYLSLWEKRKAKEGKK